MARPLPDALIAELAARQHCVVARRQLAILGISDEMIAGRVRTRMLQRLHRGVYLVGPGRPGQMARYAGAVLACGPGAVLSHRSAASLLGIRPGSSGPVDVTVSRRGTRGRPGIRVHATRRLEPVDQGERDGIRCTSPARTLVDLAAVLSPADLRRALERAERLRLFDLTATRACLEHSGGRRGVAGLGALLAELGLGEPPPTRSELEDRLLDLVRAARLPAPVVNGWVAGYEVDFHWPAARLAVETDGADTHATRAAFERDRGRDLDLALAGWRVIRVSWRQLTRQPDRVAELLRACLARG